MNIEETRLRVLFGLIARAADQQQFPLALRFADSALRFAPDNPTAILIHARLLLRTGEAGAAAERLRGRDDPESLLVFADAALQAGYIDEARSACTGLLARYAVDSLPGLSSLASRQCRADLDRYPGWVGIDSHLRLVGEAKSGSLAMVDQGQRPPRPTTTTAAPGPLWAIAHELDRTIEGPIRVRVGGRELLNSGLAWPPDFRIAGWVALEDDILVGEVRQDWNPLAPLKLAITSGNAAYTGTLAGPAGESGNRPFSVRLASPAPGTTHIDVAIIGPDSRPVMLEGSPIRLPQPAPVPVATLPAPTRVPWRTGAPPVTALNVVVPVYAGLEETLACLESVFATMPPGRITVTVVDDASPDLALRNALKNMGSDGLITLLRSKHNLGFPGAANQGIQRFPGSDVVLLNADTIVFDGWLEHLIAAAYADDRIGTVTPLGEAASILSYPANDRPAASAAEAAAIDRAAHIVNTGKLVDLPVGVGFCMYIRRRCLDEIGGLNEQDFGRGYGEEIDFCLRARQRGWRSVAATDVFIQHVGARSFGTWRQMLMARNARVINRRYPGYDALIADFVATGALREPKRAIDRQRLLESAREPILLVSHDLPGGVKRHVEVRQAGHVAAQHTVITLRAATREGRKGFAVLSVAGAEFSHLEFDVAHELAELRELLVALGFVAIEIHHFLGLPGAVLEMLAGLGVPYRIFVHDYVWICPRVSLLNGDGVYCGEPAVTACEVCVAAHGVANQEPINVAQLRGRSVRLMAGAREIIAPTDEVRQRLLRYFPGFAITVTPWEPPAAHERRRTRGKGDGIVRVALLGALSTAKGWQVLLDCARDAAARNLALEFIVVGYTRDDVPLLETGKVFITGPYREEEAGALLEREACDLALFPTVGPETWCYTLTYALAQDLLIVGFDLGAVAERLRAAGTGVLLPPTTPPATLNDKLLEYGNARLAAPEPLPIAEETPPATVAATTAPMTATTIAAARAAAPDNPPPATSGELAATVQLLSLPPGVYAFTVQNGGGAVANGLALPALQVGPAPQRCLGTVDFMCGPTTLDRWLTSPGDVVTVKISGGDATLLLTSVRTPESSTLAIDVHRLGAVVAPPHAE